jgi:hypothetical protein
MQAIILAYHGDGDGDKKRYFPPGVSIAYPIPTGVHFINRRTLYREYFISMAGVAGFDLARHGEQCLKQQGRVWLPMTQRAQEHCAVFAACFYMMRQTQKIQNCNAGNTMAIQKLKTAALGVGDACPEQRSRDYKALSKFLNRDFVIGSIAEFVTSEYFQKAKNLYLAQMRHAAGWEAKGNVLDPVKRAEYDAIWTELQQRNLEMAATAESGSESESDSAPSDQKQPAVSIPDDASSVASSIAPIVLTGEKFYDLLMKSQETVMKSQETVMQLSQDNTTQHAGRDATAQAQLKVTATALDLAKSALTINNNPEAAQFVPTMASGAAIAVNTVAKAATLDDDGDDDL